MSVAHTLLNEVAGVVLRGNTVHHLVFNPPGYAYFRAEYPSFFNRPTYAGFEDTFRGIRYTLGAGLPDPYAWVRPFVIVTDQQMVQAAELARRARPAEERASELLEDIINDLAEHNNVDVLMHGTVVRNDAHQASIAQIVRIDGKRYTIGVSAIREN